jgi:hypothetical protein
MSKTVDVGEDNSRRPNAEGRVILDARRVLLSTDRREWEEDE